MNRKQKICLWVGIIVIGLMGLYPPVQKTKYRLGDIFRTDDKTPYKVIEYTFVLDTGNGTVVLSNLFVQWIVVSIITGGLIYSFKDKKSKDDRK